MSENDTIDKTGTGTGIEIRPETKKPAMYAVVVHNDPFTPRAFVVELLQRFFQKTGDDASRIMLKAHNTGSSVVAIYTYEVAETKSASANKYAHDQGKFLLFSVEEV